MNEEIVIQAVIVIAAVAFVAYLLFFMKNDKRKDEGVYGYFKRETEGVSVDVCLRRNDGEVVVIKSFLYYDRFADFGQDDNRKFAHVLADELLYYLNQDYTEQLTEDVKR